MYRLISFKLHLIMIIPSILVFGYVNRISSESISSQTWSNIIHDLSLKIHDDKTVESYPLNEGFILFADNHKKPSTATTRTSKPVRLSLNNRSSKSHNISTTTCKTVVIVNTKSQTSPPIVNHSVGHLGRRLLNEPSHDTDIDKTLQQTPIEIDSFFKVDDEELSKQLFNAGVAMDGSGDTTEDTTEQTSQSTMTSRESTTSSTTLLTTTTTIGTQQPILSNTTKFILIMNCTNANTTLHEILEELRDTFRHEIYNIIHNETQCDDSGKANVILEIITDNKTNVVNDLLENLTKIAIPKDVEIFSDNICGNNEIVSVTDVTACYLINLCSLCGIRPRRGVCLPENKESKCVCLDRKNDSIRYVGDLCIEENIELTKPLYIPARWTPVIVGVLAGLTGLFCAITCCLWAVAVWRRRRYIRPDLRIRRLWHLPRAKFPQTVTSENDLNNTISTSSSNQTDSDYNKSNITDSTFFRELDQKMSGNLRATITRPNTQAMLASLPLNTLTTLNNYDPIDELDSIIDNEDVNMTFHDPLNELYDDNEMLEAINPNVKLPRPNVDPKPTGLFSVRL